MNDHESKIQRHIAHWYRKQGWIVFKINPGDGSSPPGWPDLVCLGPKGQTSYVEVKRGNGARVSKAQELVHEELRRMGHSVLVVSDVQGIEQAQGETR